MKTGKNWCRGPLRRLSFFSLATFFLLHLGVVCAAGTSGIPEIREEADDNVSWKVGVGKAVITPKADLWMSGYAARETPAEGKIHDLWVKTLAFEDASGKRAFLITCDIIGFSRALSEDISHTLMERYNLPRSAIALCSSHNHSGPVVNENLFHIYPPFDRDMKAAVEQYGEWLKRIVTGSADDAVRDLSPVVLSTGTGIARFAVNRRENKASEVLYAIQLSGPYDHTVPVIAAHRPGGVLKAVAFGYACHATTLDACMWSGDYPGFAQNVLENRYGSAAALFFAGCGGDQNPLPRRSVSLAAQYGGELALAVEAVLEGPMRQLVPDLCTTYTEIPLYYAEPPSADSLQKIVESDSGYRQRWAKAQLSVLNSGTVRPVTYPWYPVQAWSLGEQSMVLLGGEVVVDYAAALRKARGENLWVAAYANDVMAYIPSERVLEEGGYEGHTSMCVYGHPAKWASGLENAILETALEGLKALDECKVR